MEVRVLDDAASVADAAAELVAAQVTAGAPTLGLSGGSTPRAAYRRLAGMQLNWWQTTLWLGDERWVAPGDADSNVRMVREAFVDEVGARLLVPDYALGDPAAAAAAYSDELAAAFEPAGGPGLILLGMGEDGHTASLFPGTIALEAAGARYVPTLRVGAAAPFVQNWVPEMKVWRLTATFDLLWQAQQLVFLVTGRAKAPVLAEIIDDDSPYPAQRAGAGAESALWLVDREAASQLTTVG